MFFLSRIAVWIPLYLAIIFYIGKIYKKKVFLIVLFIAAAVALSDQGALAIKNSVHRLRPCHDPDLQGLVHLVKGACGGFYGFVSSHAANTFNVALLSLMYIKKSWYSFFILIWASAVSYSRIYLGVHYPGDVICGALLGSIIGWSIFKLYELFDHKFLKSR